MKKMKRGLKLKEKKKEKLAKLEQEMEERKAKLELEEKERKAKEQQEQERQRKESLSRKEKEAEKNEKTAKAEEPVKDVKDLSQEANGAPPKDENTKTTADQPSLKVSESNVTHKENPQTQPMATIHNDNNIALYTSNSQKSQKEVKTAPAKEVHEVPNKLPEQKVTTNDPTPTKKDQHEVKIMDNMNVDDEKDDVKKLRSFNKEKSKNENIPRQEKEGFCTKCIIF